MAGFAGRLACWFGLLVGWSVVWSVGELVVGLLLLGGLVASVGLVTCWGVGLCVGLGEGEDLEVPPWPVQSLAVWPVCPVRSHASLPSRFFVSPTLLLVRALSPPRAAARLSCSEALQLHAAALPESTKEARVALQPRARRRSDQSAEPPPASSTLTCDDSALHTAAPRTASAQSGPQRDAQCSAAGEREQGDLEHVWSARCIFATLCARHRFEWWTPPRRPRAPPRRP